MTFFKHSLKRARYRRGINDPWLSALESYLGEIPTDDNGVRRVTGEQLYEALHVTEFAVMMDDRRLQDVMWTLGYTKNRVGYEKVV